MNRAVQNAMYKAKGEGCQSQLTNLVLTDSLHPLLCIFITTGCLSVLNIQHESPPQIRTVHLDTIEAYCSSMNAQVIALKSNTKIYSKTASPCFSTVTPSSGSAIFVLVKVTDVTIANYSTSVCGDVAAYTWYWWVLVGVCLLHCSEVNIVFKTITCALVGE
jgi:hypothetical protein